MSRNFAFIDVETTGFNPEIHEIIEIGIVIVKPNMEVVEEVELKIKPEHIERAEPQALRINRYDPNAWFFALRLPEAMKIVSEKTRDAIMVAHNVSFDYGFLEAAFRKSSVPNLMHYHRLDTISIAYAKRSGDASRYALSFLCDELGVEHKHAHTALADARATYQVFRKLLAK